MYGKRDEVAKLQNFVRELASVKQFNTFEEQFTMFKREIQEKYYKADQIDSKVEGMRIFSNNHYTSKEDTAKNDEKY